jgi:hypothetical protein
MSAHRSAPTPVPTPVPSHRAAAAERLPPLLAPPYPPTVPARAPSRLTPAGRTFLDGVNGFCRSFYLEQRAADEQYPNDSHGFSVLQESEDRSLVVRLQHLQPPPALADTFAQFVANEQRVVQARVKETSTDSTVRSEGDDEYNGAVVSRHAYAHQLGAAECDGLLPAAQWRAAARAAQRFTLTRDPRQECRTLVTPAFLTGQWPSARSPLAACARQLEVRWNATPQLRNIRVSDLTGVEQVSATVTFAMVPDCGCGDLVVRLYFEHGHWLVRDAYPA